MNLLKANYLLSARVLNCIAFAPVVFLFAPISAFAQDQPPSFLIQLKKNAVKLKGAFAKDGASEEQPSETFSDLAMSFLSAAESLKEVSSRTIYRRKGSRTSIAPADYQKLLSSEKEEYEKIECGEKTYYGNYSTPLAWARPFDRLSRHGLSSFDGKRVLDFGFGNVGQLRMIASQGATVTGVEVEGSIASAMYRRDTDQGQVEKLSDAVTNSGSLKLVYGSWPAEQSIVESVGDGYDLIISKNVLKYGYIHPERKAPSAQLIDLGVDDKTFLRHLFRILKPGGVVLIYNLHPPKSAPSEPYKPWAYGETPWTRDLVKKAGFEILEWHIDDSNAIHQFGREIGWDSSFPSNAEFEKNFRAMCTILKKPS